MNTVEILKKAKERIGTPDQWYQGHYGRGLSANDLANGASGACCIVGALCYAARTGRTVDGPVGDAASALEVAGGLFDIVHFNDDSSTTHADIMALFDRAIAAMEARP